MPIDYKKYPDNWKTEIRPRIMNRAMNRCELCGVKHMDTVLRLKKNADIVTSYFWYPVSSPFFSNANFKLVKIIITIHHIDGNIKNNDDLNLIALCQRCHLKLDMQKHVKKRGKK